MNAGVHNAKKNMSVEVFPGVTETLKRNESCPGIAWLIGSHHQSATQLYSAARCLTVAAGTLQDVEKMEASSLVPDLGDKDGLYIGDIKKIARSFALLLGGNSSHDFD